VAGKLVGILALQGDFSSHQRRLEELGAGVRLIRKAEQLQDIDALVIPGGESTTLLRLADLELRSALQDFAQSGKAVLATCAGLIFLASDVRNPSQESLAVLNLAVSRNAYGRQTDSFIDSALTWTKEGRRLGAELLPEKTLPTTLEGVFIRAPRILEFAPSVEVLVTRENEPVLIREGAVFAAAFHPELSADARIVHEMFLAAC
jgi:5'-phosphate synthase pdxT subunit